MKSPTHIPRYLFLIVFLCIAFFHTIYGQTAVDTAKFTNDQNGVRRKTGIKTPADFVSGFEQFEKGNIADKNPVSGVTINDFNDQRLDSVKLNAWKNYYRYMSQGYKHRYYVFTWQLLSSVIIFGLVIFLVLTGIYFAWLQFKQAMNQKEKGEDFHVENLTTELNLSTKEIKVSSPVLGVIILIISLAFFYLYLVYVYPIDELF